MNLQKSNIKTWPTKCTQIAIGPNAAKKSFIYSFHCRIRNDVSGPRAMSNLMNASFHFSIQLSAKRFHVSNCLTLISISLRTLACQQYHFIFLVLFLFSLPLLLGLCCLFSFLMLCHCRFVFVACAFLFRMVLCVYEINLTSIRENAL